MIGRCAGWSAGPAPRPRWRYSTPHTTEKVREHTTRRQTDARRDGLGFGLRPWWGRSSRRDRHTQKSTRRVVRCALLRSLHEICVTVSHGRSSPSHSPRSCRCPPYLPQQLICLLASLLGPFRGADSSGCAFPDSGRRANISQPSIPVMRLVARATGARLRSRVSGCRLIGSR